MMLHHVFPERKILFTYPTLIGLLEKLIGVCCFMCKKMFCQFIFLHKCSTAYFACVLLVSTLFQFLSCEIACLSQFVSTHFAKTLSLFFNGVLRITAHSISPLSVSSCSVWMLFTGVHIFIGNVPPPYFTVMRLCSFVLTLMLIQLVFPSKSCSTPFAPVLLLSWMHTLVFIQGQPFRKRFPTLLAFVRLFSCMYTLVCLQAWQLRKRLCTNRAAIRFFPCVHTLVLLQGRLFRKRFPTLLAFVRFFSCMYTLVGLQAW